MFLWYNEQKAVIFMNIKAAIFDMDGTLVDSLMIWNVIWSAFGEKYLNDPKFAPRTEDDKMVRTLPLKDAMSLIHRNYALGKSGEELLALANEIMLDFYANRVELKSNVKEFLEFCNDRGVKMCIASATAPELIRVALKHCDIEKYFLKIFSCSLLGKGKESPDVFLLANEFLNEKTEDTWVFEDSLTAIETATKIGMKTVGIYDRFNYGQERIREIATVYIAPEETLLKLIK
jgi:HAD superfamily hydrolase (TIGR01509 family)